jgi:antitoxin component of MazEF toxin-antitoxin module
MQYLIELVPYGENAVVLLPDELLQITGWKAGDELSWKVESRRLLLTRTSSHPHEQAETPIP